VSNDRRAALEQEVGLAVRTYQTAVDEIDEAATGSMGLNRTDGRCLDILERKGRMSAGELAAESGLTSGAITSVLDRLETKGYVRRVRSESDRRKVYVELEDKAHRCIQEIYGPVAAQGSSILGALSDEELACIRDFLLSGRALLARHAARVREGMPEETGRRRADTGAATRAPDGGGPP
jgi:DNA-binding MarR family transcriptional regulator